MAGTLEHVGTTISFWGFNLVFGEMQRNPNKDLGINGKA